MDNIKVYLSYNEYFGLSSDAFAFGVVKKDGSPNLSLLCNMIIKNLYQFKIKNNSLIINNIVDLISKYIPDNKLNSVIKEIEYCFDYYKDSYKISNEFYILIRPRKENELIFNTIIDENLNGEPISKYFRSMFNYYFSLPQDKREMILFKDEADLILLAIENNNVLKVKFGNSYHTCMPFGLMKTKEKLYNYFIFFEDSKNNRRQVNSVHLHKINQIINTYKEFVLNDQDYKLYYDFQKNGIQFNHDRIIDSKIVLTNQGQKLWRKMYLNRPIPNKIENDNTLYFYTSYFNLYSYFSRFGKEAKVIYPRQLKKEIYKFHLEAVKAYKEV